jgi:hypothetical protein
MPTEQTQGEKLDDETAGDTTAQQSPNGKLGQHFT